jgi:hypothetical protein
MQNTTNQCAVSDTPAPLSLADQLRIKRANIAKTANAACKRLDRQIALLEQTGAEATIRKAEELLSE